MENASKALLIAGAILIVIILIGIGVAVINSTSNIQDQAGSSADSMAAQTFNAQFTAYEGTAISANQVKALMSLIKASNATNGYSTAPTNAKTDKYVYLDNSAGCITSTSGLTKNSYSVEITDYSNGGYVNKITIK